MGIDTIHLPSKNNDVPIHNLGGKFYHGARNEVTGLKLIELSHLARNIMEPKPYGKYFNEEHYLQTLDLVLGSTEETRHRGIFFLRKVLPYLTSKKTLLDVGPGCGTLTRWIGKDFNHITVVDNNLKIIENLNKGKRITRKKAELLKIQGSILDAKLPFNFYDLGVISHVLYYIDKDEWLNVVRHVYNAVKPEGMIVIALSGDQNGKAELIKHFGGELIDINYLAKTCSQQFGSSCVKMFASNEAFYTLDITAMLHIAGFFLCDAHITATREELLTYLTKHCLMQNNRFELSTQQKFILIAKKFNFME